MWVNFNLSWTKGMTCFQGKRIRNRCRWNEKGQIARKKKKTIHIHIDEIHTSIHTTTSIRKEKKWLDSKTMSKFQTSRFDCWIVIYWRCDWIRWSNWIYCCWRICKWNIWCWWKRGNRWWRGLLLLLSWCDIGFDILN